MHNKYEQLVNVLLYNTCINTITITSITLTKHMHSYYYCY